jgi:hypothetical protein
MCFVTIILYITIGEQDEYHIVVFLNSETPPAGEAGMRIFTSEFTACLRHHGVSKAPKIHRNFLSAMGSLAVEADEDCDEFYSEIVPRESNRIVVLSPKETFRFESYIDTPQPKRSFVKSTQLALVYVFA